MNTMYGPKSAQKMALFSLSVAASLIAALYVFIHLANPSDPIDGLFVSFLGKSADTKIYAERVATVAEISGKRLKIEGIYYIDKQANQYLSFSTTTITDLSVTNPKKKIFTLDNAYMDDLVFYRIGTRDSSLSYILSNGTGWQHVPGENIPSRLSGIAIAGPIMDDLQIFSEEGRYLTDVRRLADNVELSQVHYRMHLSEARPSADSTILGTIRERLGKSGTIDLWLNASSSLPVAIHLVGENYQSTSTIESIGSVSVNINSFMASSTQKMPRKQSSLQAQ